MKIGYLATASSDVTVTAGSARVPTSVRRGLGELFVRTDSAFDSVTLTGLEPGVTLCVDSIEVGTAVPAEGAR